MRAGIRRGLIGAKALIYGPGTETTFVKRGKGSVVRSSQGSTCSYGEALSVGLRTVSQNKVLIVRELQEGIPRTLLSPNPGDLNDWPQMLLKIF